MIITMRSVEVAKRIREYVICHLAANVASEINEIAIELLENRAHPDRNTKPDERAEFLMKLAREKLDYIAQGVEDLREFEKGGSEALAESSSASRSEAGE